MRLSTILSEYEKSERRPVESIINSDKYYDPNEIMVDENRIPVEKGTVIDIDIGTLIVHFFCENRNDNVTYKSSIQHCLVVNNRVLSIDCMLECIDCDSCKDCNYYKDVSLRMKNREIDLLIVANMFLTGFDATTLNTLWVDKNLKYHGR